jgi:hypothetical protein
LAADPAKMSLTSIVFVHDSALDFAHVVSVGKPRPFWLKRPLNEQ